MRRRVAVLDLLPSLNPTENTTTFYSARNTVKGKQKGQYAKMKKRKRRKTHLPREKYLLFNVVMMMNHVMNKLFKSKRNGYVGEERRAHDVESQRSPVIRVARLSETRSTQRKRDKHLREDKRIRTINN